MSFDWLAWQIVDSAFPTGSFAHSWGLEAAWHHGAVQDAEALRRFVRVAIWQQGHSALPLVNAAYRSSLRLPEFDALSEAFLTNPVANRASRIQGRTLLSTCRRVWPSHALTVLDQRVATLCAHSAPVSGAVFRALGVPLHTVQRVLLYTAARGVLSAAVRLGLAGSFEAQRMLHASAADLNATLDECGHLDERDVMQTAPVLDILQAGHDKLYSRLFQS